MAGKQYLKKWLLQAYHQENKMKIVLLKQIAHSKQASQMGQLLQTMLDDSHRSTQKIEKLLVKLENLSDSETHADSFIHIKQSIANILSLAN